MPLSVSLVPEKVLNLPYHELAALGLDWRGYLPLVHPLSLRVITIVSLSCPTQPDPWIRADVEGGRLVRVGHPGAKEVAVLVRALSYTDLARKEPVSVPYR